MHLWSGDGVREGTKEGGALQLQLNHSPPTVHVRSVFNPKPGGDNCPYLKNRGGLMGEVAFASDLVSPLEFGHLDEGNKTQAQPLRPKRRCLC